MYYPVKKSPEIKPWFSCELEILFVCQISKSNIYQREEHSSLKRAAPLNSYYCGGARERKKVHHPPPPTGSYLGLWMLSVFWYYVCYFFELFFCTEKRETFLLEIITRDWKLTLTESLQERKEKRKSVIGLSDCASVASIGKSRKARKQKENDETFHKCAFYE